MSGSASIAASAASWMRVASATRKSSDEIPAGSGSYSGYMVRDSSTKSGALVMIHSLVSFSVNPG